MDVPRWRLESLVYRTRLLPLHMYLHVCGTGQTPAQLTDHRGFSLVWGALQDYYHTHMFPDASLSTISLVGGVQNFVRRSKVHLLLDLLSPRLWGFRRTLPAALVIDSTSS